MQSKSSRVDKRSASTMPDQKGGCAALIHPTFFAGNKFTLPATLTDRGISSKGGTVLQLSQREMSKPGNRNIPQPGNPTIRKSGGRISRKREV